MARIKANLKQKVIKINENQQEMLDTFTNKWGFISESEVLRQALTFYYRKMEPEYLQPSSNEREKIKKQKEAAALSVIPNDVYAREKLKALVVKTRDGKDVALIHAIGNSTTAIKLDVVKTLERDNPARYGFHLAELAKYSVEERLRQNVGMIDSAENRLNVDLSFLRTPEKVENNESEILMGGRAEESEEVQAAEERDETASTVSERVDEEDSESLV